MNLEQAKEIFTQGWNNRFQKPNPYKGKEAEIYMRGEEAAFCDVNKDFDYEFNLWRENNGFPLSYRERADLNLAVIPQEFRAMLESQAYDRGHAWGEEEVASLLYSLSSDFLSAWSKWVVRTGGKI